MVPYLSERENAVEHINSICMCLFDTWCEQRRAQPLGYLLHCWPLMDSQPASIRRLRDTLSELRKMHVETISPEEVRALIELADRADEILLPASMPEHQLRAANQHQCMHASAEAVSG